MKKARRHPQREGWRHLRSYEEAMRWVQLMKQTRLHRVLLLGNGVAWEGVLVL